MRRLRGRRHGKTARWVGRCVAPAWMLLALLSVLPVLSCGGSSSPSVAPPGACLDFSPAAAPAPGTVVASEGGATSCDRLALDLIITDVSDVFGAEFWLSFDPDVLRYDGYVQVDTVLASDDTDVIVVPNEQSGLVKLTITRLRGSSGGIDIIGSQFLIRLDFLREADSGGSALGFSNTRIWNGDLDLIPGVEWSGGSVAIR